MKSIYTRRVEQDIRPAIADVAWFYEPFSAWCITRINVPEAARGQGHGTALLRAICEDADTKHVELILSPESSGGLTQQELVSWYRRHGFNWTEPGYMMERKPQ